MIFFFYSLVGSLFRDVSSMNFITLISLTFIMLRNSQATEQENGSLMFFSITSLLSFICITFFSYDSVAYHYHFHTPDSISLLHYTFLIPVIKHLPYTSKSCWSPYCFTLFALLVYRRSFISTFIAFIAFNRILRN